MTIHAARYLLFALIALSAPAYPASFDCAKARTDVEGLICSDKELSELDDALAKEYADLRTTALAPGLVATDQRAWVAQRNTCRDIPCIRTAYETRLAQLRRVPRTGEDPWYVGEWIGVQRACEDSELTITKTHLTWDGCKAAPYEVFWKHNVNVGLRIPPSSNCKNSVVVLDFRLSPGLNTPTIYSYKTMDDLDRDLPSLICLFRRS